MAFLCLGLVTKKSITVDDSRAIETSFPSFFKLMADLGADIS
jgi:3-phosphoshikimate 1-carboxyvinyltransferase